jgi:hypothetical protein
VAGTSFSSPYQSRFPENSIRLSSSIVSLSVETMSMRWEKLRLSPMRPRSAKPKIQLTVVVQNSSPGGVMMACARAMWPSFVSRRSSQPLA